jgi:hypothetical protein
MASQVCRKWETEENPMSAESYRLPVSLSEEEIRFIEEIGLQAKRTGEFRLSKAAVIRALIETAMKLDIDVTSVKSESELQERMRAAMSPKYR